MTVKIVTDSTSDLPKELAEELGITVVPLNVHFDLDTFKDGVDMQADQFYHRLLTSSVLPKTSAPSPGLFKDCYSQLAQETGEIISLHISTKLSGTYEAALAGKQNVSGPCRIEVIDTKSVSMGLGLLAVTAATAAKEGAYMDDILKLVQDSMKGVYIACALDTLEFLQKGGRIGRAQAWLGSIMSIKPIISIAEGEVIPLERVRTRTKAISAMYQHLDEHIPAKDLAIIYSTDAEEANKMVAHIKDTSPQQSVHLAQFGPVLGTYVGPDSLGVIALS